MHDRETDIMRVALLSGFGPTCKNDVYFDGTPFGDAATAAAVGRSYFADRGGFALSDLSFVSGGLRHALLRPLRDAVPHLTTMTLEAILEAAGIQQIHIDTTDIWNGTAHLPAGQIDAVLVSTSYIWDMSTLGRALNFARQVADGRPVVLGGQYANIRFRQILARHPDIHCILRGDAEQALPALLIAIRDHKDLHDIPNLVYPTADGRVAATPRHEIRFEDWPAPRITGDRPAIPYESMRGCPFTCGFCSFPFASPHWRYRTAERIARDWATYAEGNGTRLINAMDSTFTVPPRRMEALLDLLPSIGISWEAYSRANYLKDTRQMDRLAAGGCRTLSIGFESMHDGVLAAMSKKVTAAQNRRAFDLLRGGEIGFRCSFMVGYPGETPEAYRATSDFLVSEYEGHFKLHVFGMTDEAMPVWADRARFGLEVGDEDDPDFDWRHDGMDATTATRLNHDTIDQVRRRNEHAVLHMWQDRYQRYLLPHLSRQDNLKVEKIVERIAMLPRDHPDPATGMAAFDRLLDAAARFGITRTDPATHCGRDLITD